MEKTVKKDALVGVDTSLPDKALYDKAEDAIKHGRFDVGRLDLQALLNTYTESQYMMHAKLAIADSWYQEGGTAALTQAEQEYTDFITFFPNAPEAAEAQMRIGDIYYRQMDKPDRDNSNTIKAEAAYRQMLQQFPDSILVPQAKQKLREVQEALASGEADVAAFYVTRANLSAAIARYQTVADTYPLYSHMDDVLIALGDAYETEAKFARGQRLPEAAKAQLEKLFDDQAYSHVRKVVTEHSAAPHVEDARDRILAMGRPVPTPTTEQAAASEALENSRGQYTLSKRATLLFLHQADTVPAATVGDPPLEDAKPTLRACRLPPDCGQLHERDESRRRAALWNTHTRRGCIGCRQRCCSGRCSAHPPGRAQRQRNDAGREFDWFLRRNFHGHRDRPANARFSARHRSNHPPGLPRHCNSIPGCRPACRHSGRRRQRWAGAGWPAQSSATAAGGKTRGGPRRHQRRDPGFAAARASRASRRQES